MLHPEIQFKAPIHWVENTLIKNQIKQFSASSTGKCLACGLVDDCYIV